MALFCKKKGSVMGVHILCIDTAHPHFELRYISNEQDKQNFKNYILLDKMDVCVRKVFKKPLKKGTNEDQ